jgi:hypothetical protein
MGPINDPIKFVFLQLSGASPRVRKQHKRMSQPLPYFTPHVVLDMERSGESHKDCGTMQILGTKTVPGVNNGTEASCYYTTASRTGYSTSPLALKSRLLPGGAGAGRTMQMMYHWALSAFQEPSWCSS